MQLAINETTALKDTLLIDMLPHKRMEAFSLLYDSYAGAIYGIICQQINNEEKAKEILTNVFINFYKKLKNNDSTRQEIFISLYRITNEIICNCKF